jgi:hypothetical protein
MEELLNFIFIFYKKLREKEKNIWYSNKILIIKSRETNFVLHHQTPTTTQVENIVSHIFETLQECKKQQKEHQLLQKTLYKKIKILS